MTTYFADPRMADDSGAGTSAGTAKKTLYALRTALQTGSGHTLMLPEGLFIDPNSSGLQLAYLTTCVGLTIDTYAGPGSGKPTLELRQFEAPSASGWTQVLGSNVFKKVLTASPSAAAQRLSAGATNSGILLSQRTIGENLLRSLPATESEADIVASMPASGVWYGGPNALGYATYVYVPGVPGAQTPPDYYNGLSFIQQNSSGGYTNAMNIQGGSHDMLLRNVSVFGGTYPFNIQANNADGAAPYNIALDGAEVYGHSSTAIRVYHAADTPTPTLWIKDVDVKRAKIDALLSTGLPTDIANIYMMGLEGIGFYDQTDSCSVYDTDIFDCSHNGIVFGAYFSNAAIGKNGTADKCRIGFSPNHTYARPFSTFMCENTRYNRITVTGRNVPCQLSGSVVIENSVWVDSKIGARKPDRSEMFAVSAYEYVNSDTGQGTQRFVAMQPVAVVVRRCTFPVVPQNFLMLDSAGATTAVQAWPSDALTFDQNVIGSLAGYATYTDAAVTGGPDPQPPIFTNSFVYNGKVGDDKVFYKGTYYSINAAAASSGNDERDPQVMPNGAILPTSPAYRAGARIGGTRDMGGRQRPYTPSCGAFEPSMTRMAILSDPVITITQQPAIGALRRVAEVVDVSDGAAVDSLGKPCVVVARRWFIDAVQVSDELTYTPISADTGKAIAVQVQWVGSCGSQWSNISAGGTTVDASSGAAVAYDLTLGAIPDAMQFTSKGGGTYFSASGALVVAARNEPRFDHDLTTHAALGLLIEPQSTNHFGCSNTPSNASYWKQAGSTPLVPTNNQPDPFGGTDATLFTIPDVGTDYRMAFNNDIPCQIGEVWTLSFWVKSNVAGNLSVRWNPSAQTGYVAVTTEWTRVSFTFNPVSTLASLKVYTIYNGTNTCGKQIWQIGAQMEKQPAATSLIVTPGASPVTRYPDILTSTSSDFDRWFNPNEGTLIVKARKNGSLASAFAAATVNDGTANNAIELIGGATTSGAHIARLGTSYDTPTLSAYALGVEQKAGVAYAAGVAKYSKGGAITAASAPTAPIVGTGLQIGASQAGVQFGGHIAAFEYLPTKMTDAELQAATT